MTVKVSKPEINVREKISELDKPSGVAGQAMLAAETPQEQFNLIGAGRRNLLINGSFMVTQRGNYTDSATSISAGTTNTYHLDRWQIRTIGANAEDRRITNGFQTNSIHGDSYRMTATSSGSGYLRFLQRMEGNLAGNWITFSGWVKSNSNQARLYAYKSWLGTRVASKAHSGNGSWEYLSVTYYDEATGGDNTTLYFDAAIASETFGSHSIQTGDYFEVAQLQVELGQVATPFEHRSYGEELALCQRYYQVLANNNADLIALTHKWNSTNIFAFCDLPVEMRTQPSLDSNISTVSSALRISSMGYHVTGNNLTLDGDSSPRKLRLNTTMNNSNFTNGSSGWLRVNNSTIYVNVDAEL